MDDRQIQNMHAAMVAETHAQMPAMVVWGVLSSDGLSCDSHEIVPQDESDEPFADGICEESAVWIISLPTGDGFVGHAHLCANHLALLVLRAEDLWARDYR